MSRATAKKPNTNSKNKSRSHSRTPSPGLNDYLGSKFKTTMPVAALTAAHKLYGKDKPLEKEHRFITRFAD